MRNFFYMLAAYLAILVLHAQNSSGTVQEKDGYALGGATVTLLQAADSVVVKLAVTASLRPSTTAISPTCSPSWWIRPTS